MQPLKIKRISSDHEIDVIDTIRYLTIEEAISGMQEALNQKNAENFKKAEEEVQRLFREKGYAE